METSMSDETSDIVELVTIVPDGDIILDVTFETSKKTLKAARAARAARKVTKGKPNPDASLPPLKPTLRVQYRVYSSVLREVSKYFRALLGFDSYAEGKTIETAFKELSLQGTNPSEAATKDLPHIAIHVDDKESQSANQQVVFEDIMDILHGIALPSAPVTMHFLATMGVLADRFDCLEPVMKGFKSELKFKSFKWPATQTRLSRYEDGEVLTAEAEGVLRQKIYVAWLFNQPLKFEKSTAELILYGSRRWSALGEDDETDSSYTAPWWQLPDNIETELQERRTCILNTIASIPQHFLKLYTSRDRQCKLGYDSSSSCDSYQLGETIKFLVKHNLFSLVDFSPSSLQRIPDFATVEINYILGLLKQFPGYQIDKNHTNCGLRTRIRPILDVVASLLSSRSVSLSRTLWASDRQLATWTSSAGEGGIETVSLVTPPTSTAMRVRAVHNPFKIVKTFEFTRSIASEQQLRHAGALGSDGLARAMFTANEWDWTPQGS
ncbi:hypothetical protein B0H66DRAFT_321457 [Apodospora peruviana]|uniref:BTB domain-containing protein n=1 Tax=Apodospora peruviana TaxID=516989 RepID=A0AAE0M0N5_9PEZI|nr:hypothetical protein B0H66DRAFT_321457 [Apodospora peruviana]